MTLIELVVAMAIMVVLSAMIVVVWIALQGSFDSTASNAAARSTARDAMARMRKEIRDAQTGPDGQHAIVVAAPYHIEIYTPYNDSSGDVEEVDYWYRSSSGTTGYISRSRNGGAEMVVAKNVVNVMSSTPLFAYTYVDASGSTVTASSVSGALTSSVLTVHLHIMVDTNPGHSPTYVDLVSTAQPRNQRQF